SSEQFGPDDIINTTIPGLYRARVYFWGPSTGDQLNSVSESGLRLNFSTADILPAHSQSLTFLTAIPDAVKDGRLQLRFVPQARVRPMDFRITVTALGWKLGSPGTEHVQWDKTLNLSWVLHHRHGA